MRKLLVSAALLTASAAATAATYEVTLVKHEIGRANNPPSVSLLQPAPSFDGDTGNIPAPTYLYNSDTKQLTSTGEFHVRSQTNPTSFGRVFDRYIVDLAIDAAAGVATATSYNCVNGGFSIAVGASFCGNYSWGANFTDESTTVYSGLDVTRTMGGDDTVSGEPQDITDYNLTEASFAQGAGGLVLRSADWIEQPQTPANSAGTQLTFDVGAEVTPPSDDAEAVDDSFNVLQDSSNVSLDVRANDPVFSTLAADAVTITITGAPDQAGTATPDAGTATVTYTPAGGFTGTETFTYTITDGTNTDDGLVTVTVEADTQPAAGTGAAISVSSQNGSTTAGTLDVSTLAGYSPGNAPATVSISTDANTGTEGSCTATGTTISFTRVAGFAAGGATTTCAYVITDNNGDVTAPASVTITVAEATPTVAAGSITTEQDTASAAFSPAITAGNGAVSAHTLAVVTNGTKGSCAVSGTTVIYTPNAGETGSDSCTVTATDVDGDISPEATLSITINAAAEEDDEIRLPGGGSAVDLWSLALLGGLPLLRRRRRA